MRLPFSGSEDSYRRLDENPCEQKFVITVRRLHSTNVIQPHCREVSQALEGDKTVPFIGFFVCNLLSLKEFSPSVSRVNIRIPAFLFCPFKTPGGLTTFFYFFPPILSLSSHQAMNCFLFELLL